MDPITVIGAIAAASQLIEQTSYIVTLVVKVYKNIEGAPKAIQSHMSEVKNLENISKRIQQNKTLQTGEVYEALRACLAPTREVLQILSKLDGYHTRKPIMMVMREPKIIALFAEIERYKNSLQLCIEETTSAAVNTIGNHTAMLPLMAQNLQTLLSPDSDRTSQTQSKSPIERDYFEVPNRHARDFVGRQDVLNQIVDAFTSNHRQGLKIAVVRAMGGQGKTQVALKSCLKLRTKIPAIFWVDATSEALVKQSFDGIADHIKPETLKLGSTDSRVSYVMKALEGWTKPWLLIFDNHDDPLAFNIRDFIPESSIGSILVTTRHSDVDNLATEGLSIELSCLLPAEALELLAKRVKAAKLDFDPQSGEKAVERLGYHALAIDQAASYISKRRLPIHHFLEHFEAQKRAILREIPQMSQYRRRFNDTDKETCLSVFATWELSLQQLQAEEGVNCGSVRLLTLMAFCRCGDITEKMFRYCDFNTRREFSEYDYETNSEGSSRTDDSHDFSLQDEDLRDTDFQGDSPPNHQNETYTTKPDHPNPGENESHCIVCFVRGCFQDPHEPWNKILFSNVLARFSQLSLVQSLRFDNEDNCYHLTIHPLVCDWIQLRINAIDMRSRYAYVASLVLSNIVDEAREWTGGLLILCDHFSSNLDLIMIETLNFREVQKLVWEILLISRAYIEAGNRGESAELMVRRGLELAKSAKMNNKNRLNSAFKLELVGALNNQDRLVDSKRLCVSLLESAWLNYDSLDFIFEVISSLSNVLRRLGDDDENHKLITTYRSLDEVASWLQKHRKYKLYLAIRYARSLLANYKYHDAEAILENVLHEAKDFPGKSNHPIDRGLETLGELKSLQKQYTAAEEYLRQTIYSYSQIYGEDNQLTLITMRRLSIVLAESGRASEGLHLISRVLQQQKHITDTDNSEFCCSLLAMSGIETKLGDFAKATVHAEAALKGFHRRYGIHTPDTSRAMYQLAILTPLPPLDEGISQDQIPNVEGDDGFVAPPLPKRREPTIYQILLKPRNKRPREEFQSPRPSHCHS